MVGDPEPASQTFSLHSPMSISKDVPVDDASWRATLDWIDESHNGRQRHNRRTCGPHHDADTIPGCKEAAQWAASVDSMSGVAARGAGRSSRFLPSSSFAAGG